MCPMRFSTERPTFADYIRILAERGELARASIQRNSAAGSRTPTRNYAYERTRPDGRVIEIRHNPVPDGGFVLIFPTSPSASGTRPKSTPRATPPKPHIAS